VAVSQVGNILAVMAHPDDAELWAGGTLALHARASSATILVSSTEGSRRSEAAKGASILGASLELVDELSPDVCREALMRLLPNIVITHRLDDVHPDHRRTAEALLEAVPGAAIKTGYPKRVYSCDSYESLTINGKVQGQVIVDVTSTFEIKLAALGAHRSQPTDHFSRMAERLAAVWGARIGSTWGEAFDPIPVLGRLPPAAHL
jgi:LmbE family N-acetylglucosaminyl deacetylase